MALYKLTVKLSNFSFSFLKRLTSFLDALHSGFWLGVMGQKGIDYFDEDHYRRAECYVDDKYNEAGLYDWEKPFIEKHFSQAKTILLIAAGGGREALALCRMGYEVDSYECNPLLVDYGNRLLGKNNLESKINFLPRNSVPEKVRKYDGIIIGWGAFSHIQGHNKRLLFLKNLLPFLKENGPLMISFIWVKERNKRDKMIKNISGCLGFGRKKEKIIPGDKLAPNFIHYFTKEEITGELTQSGYRIVEYSEADTGCVIASV